MLNKIVKPVLSMARTVKSRPYMSGLIAISILFLVLEGWIFSWSIVFGQMELFDIISSVCFFVYAFVYLACNEKFSNRIKLLLKVVFILFIFNLLFTVLATENARAFILALIVDILLRTAVNFLIFTAILLLLSVAILLRKYFPLPVLCIFFILAFVFVLLYFYPGLVFQKYLIADEEYVLYADVGIFLHGMNPYTTSAVNMLWANVTAGNVYSATLTTSNRIIGNMNYPALYLFAAIPFYLLSPPTPLDFDTIDTGIARSFSMFILLVVIVFCLKKKYLRNPAYSLIIFIGYLAFPTTDPIIGLFLALLVLAYVYLDSRYSWLILGLCASAQELMWFPVALLILYSANNLGLKKGAYNLIGTILVFLIINSYFIALNPVAFFQGIATPTGSPQLPNPNSAVGYLYSVVYGTSITISSLIFGLTMLTLLIAFIYFNKKRLIGLLSLLPFIFLDHSFPYYYSFFLCFMFIALFVNDERERRGFGIIGSALRKNSKITFAIISLTIFVTLTAIFLSHGTYSKNFNLAVFYQCIINKAIGAYSVIASHIEQ